MKIRKPRTRAISKTPPRARGVDQAAFAEFMGAEPVARVPQGGSPLSIAAVRRQLFESLRSAGGRPALEGTTRRQKIPMSDSDWQALADLARSLSQEGAAVSAGQVAAQILRSAIAELQRSSEPRYLDPTEKRYLPVSDSARPVTVDIARERIAFLRKAQNRVKAA